ncbi:DUF2290 domain-containing protein [Rhizorhabdus wittichii]|uniref:DUF2290 domain-containing protein n=1 Tax=Rhizorhabdus wittichii TaxID=160791 RepID=UPI00178C5757|nr:DUF2290 domain-containing protein [Rhizorhabdus wittichii]
MNEKDIARSLLRAWEFVKAVGVGELFSDPSSIKVSDAFKSIALDPKATYEDVYLEGLSGSQYNILLADYSFFQFGGSDPNSLRYAYYPNPFLGASKHAVSELAELRAYVDEGVLDVDEFLHRVSELRFTQHPPLVRYENSPSQYVELIHPCSHLHIGHHSENRWPVRRVLSPSAFTLLLLKLFYPDFWREGEKIPSGENSLTLDEVLAVSKQDCPMLPNELFSATAERQFFLA